MFIGLIILKKFAFNILIFYSFKKSFFYYISTCFTLTFVHFLYTGHQGPPGEQGPRGVGGPIGKRGRQH